MIRGKGSFTIEAAVIVPLLLMILLTVVSMAVDLYQETIEIVAEISNKEGINLTMAMYHLDSVKELFLKLKN